MPQQCKAAAATTVQQRIRILLQGNEERIAKEFIGATPAGSAQKQLKPSRFGQ
jgi:hypothetical protein